MQAARRKLASTQTDAGTRHRFALVLESTIGILQIYRGDLPEIPRNGNRSIETRKYRHDAGQRVGSGGHRVHVQGAGFLRFAGRYRGSLAQNCRWPLERHSDSAGCW